jgi:hypothetical protein
MSHDETIIAAAGRGHRAARSGRLVRWRQFFPGLGRAVEQEPNAIQDVTADDLDLGLDLLSKQPRKI